MNLYPTRVFLFKVCLFLPTNKNLKNKEEMANFYLDEMLIISSVQRQKMVYPNIMIHVIARKDNQKDCVSYRSERFHSVGCQYQLCIDWGAFVIVWVLAGTGTGHWSAGLRGLRGVGGAG